MQSNSDSHSRKVVTDRNGEQGFSLLELILAMVIFLMVTGTVWGLLQVAQRSRSVVNQQVPLTKSVRLGLNLLGRDTYNAGFGYPTLNTGRVVLPNNRISVLLGVPNDSEPARDTVPPIIAGNNITLNTFNTTAGVLTDQVTFLFKDPTFNLGPLASPPPDRFSQPLNINAVITGGAGTFNQIVPVTGVNAACQINDIYLVTGNGGSTLLMATNLVGTDRVQFANGDPLGLNQVASLNSLDGIVLPATMQRVQMVTYFVTPDGILTRREFGNAPGPASVDEPLVYGVEDFQIQYLMNNGALIDNPADPDGIPGNLDDNQTNLSAVRQIRFTVSVRSTELNAVGQPNRVAMISTFSTRNLGYDAN